MINFKLKEELVFSCPSQRVHILHCSRIGKQKGTSFEYVPPGQKTNHDIEQVCMSLNNVGEIKKGTGTYNTYVKRGTPYPDNELLKTGTFSS
jgi:hypothetical protein